jgi:hypothetical protein
MICVGMLLTTATPAIAQDAGGGLSVGVTGGTLGIGPEVGYRVNRSFGLRGNATFLGVSHNVNSDDIDYDGHLKLSSYGLMADLYPMGNGFRISAGARIDNNKVRLRATPTGDVEVGDDTYTAAEVGVLSGHVKASDFAPALTIGWGGGISRGVKLGVELGALFQGSPRVHDLHATGTLASDPDFQASLRDEEKEIEDDIDQYKVYPILQVSLGYAF